MLCPAPAVSPAVGLTLGTSVCGPPQYLGRRAGHSVGAGGDGSAAPAGELESAPVLMDAHEDGCFYEFEWHTAAACVLSRTEGDNCTVFDAQAGAYPVSQRHLAGGGPGTCVGFPQTYFLRAC